MRPGPVRMRGVLTTWNDERGFGFVAPAVGGPDVFVHVSSFTSRSPRPVVGDEVSYELEFSPDGRPRAARAENLRPEGPHPVPRIPRPVSSRAGRLGYLAIVAFGAIVLVVGLLQPIPLWVWVLYGGMTLVAFVAYAIDKRAAMSGGWRVPEASLLAIGVVGGWPGAIVAQQLLRHKTVKSSFQVTFWVSVLVNVVGFVLLAWLARSV